MKFMDMSRELTVLLAGTEVEERAREICLRGCRAGFCVDGRRCTNAWPGEGSPFWYYLAQAARELAASESDKTGHF